MATTAEDAQLLMDAFTPTQEQSLAEKEKKSLLALCSVLIVQAGSFSIIQMLNMLSMLIGSLVPKSVRTIATDSGLASLGVAEITALVEFVIRAKILLNATEEKASQDRIFLGISLLKLITVSVFCLNAFFEQTDTPDPEVAKLAGILFASLILVEIINALKMFLSLPSSNFWSVTFFVELLVKPFIFVAAMMQLLLVTAIAYGIAGVGFAAVTMEVNAARKQLNYIGGVSEETSLQSDAENVIPPSTHSVNVTIADVSEEAPLQRSPTQLSNSPTLWSEMCTTAKKMRETAEKVGPYFRGEDLSRPRPPRI